MKDNKWDFTDDFADIGVYKITKRTQKIMHIIVYYDYTEYTSIGLQTIIANRVSINIEMKHPEFNLPMFPNSLTLNLHF